MTYAVVKITGKQHKLKVGDVIVTDRLASKEGETLTLNDVLLTVDGDNVKIGTPTLTGTAVTAKVLAHTRGVKIRIATFKAKSRYRKTKGHRQDETKLEILAIGPKPKASSLRAQKIATGSRAVKTKATKPKTTKPKSA